MDKTEFLEKTQKYIELKESLEVDLGKEVSQYIENLMDENKDKNQFFRFRHNTNYSIENLLSKFWADNASWIWLYDEKDKKCCAGFSHELNCDREYWDIYEPMNINGILFYIKQDDENHYTITILDVDKKIDYIEFE